MRLSKDCVLHLNECINFTHHSYQMRIYFKSEFLEMRFTLMMLMHDIILCIHIIRACGRIPQNLVCFFLSNRSQCILIVWSNRDCVTFIWVINSRFKPFPFVCYKCAWPLIQRVCAMCSSSSNGYINHYHQRKCPIDII